MKNKNIKKCIEFKIPVKQNDSEYDVYFSRKEDGTEWIIAECGGGYHCSTVSAPQLYDWLKYHYNGIDKKA